MNELFEKTPNWKNLCKLGSNRLIKSSYLWLIIVPLLAKLLENIEDKLSVSILGASLQLSTKLPFSWSMFYLSAVCFAAALLLTNIYFPVALKRYSSYDDWLSTGRGEESIIHAFFNAYRNTSFMYPLVVDDYQKTYFLKYHLGYDGDHKKIHKNEFLIPIELIKKGVLTERKREAYYYVTDIYDRSQGCIRLIISFFYFLGFLFLFLVFSQNFLFVIGRL